MSKLKAGPETQRLSFDMTPDRAAMVARVLALAAFNRSSDSDLFSALRKTHVTLEEVRWLRNVPSLAYSPALENAESILSSFAKNQIEPSGAFRFFHVEQIVRDAHSLAQAHRNGLTEAPATATDDPARDRPR